MGDWETRDIQQVVPQRLGSQYRSQSLPRLLRNGLVVEANGVQLGTSVAESRERFQRTAHTVGDCLQAVKGLSQQANSARSFREKCSNLLGAAIAASLALQEALSSYKGAAGDLNIQAIATDVQKQLLSADALVRKYGQERLWDSFVRFESKEDVDKKFDSIIQALQALTNRTWDFIDPQNRIKRDVMEQGSMSSFITTGEAFSRHSLRPASKHKVQALVAFPDEEGEGPDGVVAWAAHGSIKCLQLSSQITTELRDAGRFLVCMAYDKAGYIWSGHADGSVRLWSVQAANAAGSPAMVADAMITAIAVDPDTGYCWAGTEEGEVFVVRLKASESGSVGKLEIVRQLLGYDAHSPTARSQDSNSSHASSSRPIAASSAASSHWTGRSSAGSRRSRTPRPHHLKHRPKPHLARTAAGRDLLESCLPSQAPGSSRVKDTCVHSGPVSAIVISAGRAFTAGGSASSSAALLVWDSNRFELLRTISKRSTRWCRSSVTCLTMVHWANSRQQRAASGSLGPAASMGTTIGSGSIGSVPSSSSTNTRAACSEKHLMTGHADGSVLMWDPSGDTLKPVLLVGPEKKTRKRAVKSVAVLEELSLLACGHANGKVYMRKLDPKCRKEPRADDANISRWNPTTFSLQVHRLGLQHMVAGGHMLVTSGKTGSVKLWPETMLRCLAHEAGVQLPHSHNPVSEAVNALLNRAGLTAYASTNISQLIALAPQQQQQQPAANGGNIQQFGHQRHKSDGDALAAERSSRSEQQQQQQQQRQRDAAEAAAAIAAAEDHKPQQQQQQQQHDSEQQQEGGADARQLQRSSSSTGWSRDMRASSWMLEFDALGLDPNRRRVIGSGSYGRVEIGSFNQTDVAVKILTDLGPNQPTPAVDCPSWDEARLRALRQEVGILATLRHPNVVLFMGVCLSPPAIVTEYCPLGSLYDVLKKACTDRTMACRLTWTRRLLMALDAARGLLYLHSHKPIILHRDLKSPNLFVNNALHVKVGDFNLSRYMSLGTSFVKSSLEINPRWSAPEVLREGYYSPAADVYAFGVVLWELLTWQEPWEEDGVGSFQIMVAVEQHQQRPRIPPLDQLPGQLGPAEAVQGYLGLMSDCWAQDYTQRPNFEGIVTRLKVLLKMGGPNAAPGPAASSPAAVAAAPSPFHRNASEPALLAAGAPAAAGAPSAGGDPRIQPRHTHTRSELVGQEAAAVQGPDIADLLHLGEDDDLPGPSAPAPPAAALPPIPSTAPEAFGSLPDPQGGSSGSSTPGASTPPAAAAAVGIGRAGGGSRQVSRQISLSVGVAETPLRHGSSSSAGTDALSAAPAAAPASPFANGGVNGVFDSPPLLTAAKPPKPPKSPVAAAAGNPLMPGASSSSFSPFAIAAQQQQQQQAVPDPTAGTFVQQQQQQQSPQIPVSFGATAVAAGPGRPAAAKAASSPFAAAAQVPDFPTAAAAGAGTMKAIVIPVAVPAALGQVVEQGGSSPFSRSPIKLSPFAAAASPFAVHGSGSSPLASMDDSGSFATGMGNPAAAAVCPLEAAVDAGSAVDAEIRAARHSSSSSTAVAAGGSSSGPGSAQASTSNAAEVLRVSSPTAAGSSSSSSGGGAAAAGAAVNPAGSSRNSLAGAVGIAGGNVPVRVPTIPPPPVAVASLNAWSGTGSSQQQQQPLAPPARGASAPAVALHTSDAAADLISLDSEGLDAAATFPLPVSVSAKLSPLNPFAAAAAGGL